MDNLKLISVRIEKNVDVKLDDLAAHMRYWKKSDVIRAAVKLFAIAQVDGSYEDIVRDMARIQPLNRYHVTKEIL